MQTGAGPKDSPTESFGPVERGAIMGKTIP